MNTLPLAPFASDELNALVSKCYPLIASKAPGNVLFSPYDLGRALAMLVQATAGKTRDEIEALGIVPEQLESLGKIIHENSGDATLREATALWAGLDCVFSDPLPFGGPNHTARINYTDNKKATETINGWVGDQTDGMIPELIALGSLPENNLAAVITTALFFQGTWQTPFEENSIERPFHLLSGEEVQAVTMSKKSYFEIHSGESCDSVVLPYKDSSLELLILLPHEDRFDEVEKDWLSHIPENSEFSGEEVKLFLPKASFSQNTDLSEIFQELGIVSAFSDSADFTPLFPSGATLEEVTHEAKIEIDESGTQAAAATAMIMVGRAAMSRPKEFVVDRPYFLCLRERETGAPLFVGRVLDPRQNLNQPKEKHNVSG